MSIIPSFLTHPLRGRSRVRTREREREREREQERTYPSYLTTWVMLHTPPISRWLQLDTCFGFECNWGVWEAWSLNRLCYFNRINGVFEALLSLWFSGVQNRMYSWGRKALHPPHRKEESSGHPGVLWLCDGTCGQSAFIFRWTRGNGRAEDPGSQAPLCPSGA